MLDPPKLTRSMSRVVLMCFAGSLGSRGSASWQLWHLPCCGFGHSPMHPRKEGTTGVLLHFARVHAGYRVRSVCVHVPPKFDTLARDTSVLVHLPKVPILSTGSVSTSFADSSRSAFTAAAQCWQGMAQGSNEYSMLEEGRSKLLLAPAPLGLGAAAEVTKRLTLWLGTPLRGSTSAS